ncbi:MAG: hypothetical protein HOK38_05080 [Flavobacteriaceae bacterium]|jgi:antitoxin component YwqK of YwqJK toxin-antitoxin module|nr:hypothetical protein [Flavobacteriaceae bacterium]
MKGEKVSFFEIILFIGGIIWVFTTNSSETFWTISISLSLMFLAKSYLIYRGKKDNSSKEKVKDDKYRWEGDIEGEGLWKVYLKSGNNEILEWEINYKNGKKEGLRKQYWLNGVLRTEGNFKNGIEEGVRKDYYGDGVLKIETYYKNGKQNGLYKEYHENGQLQKEGQIVNNKMEGEFKTYESNGKLESVSNWKEGEEIDFKFSNENEELVSKSEYTIVNLYDINRNEYRYSFTDKLLPENFNEVDDDYLIKAKEYHHSLNRPNIPDDIFNEDDSVDDDNQFAYSFDGLRLSKKELENEEAEMIPKKFISSSSLEEKKKTNKEEFKTDKKVDYKNREVLTHQVEYGLFLEDYGDGIYNETEVKGQRHLLVREYQSWDEGQEDWCEYESETEDEFYLTINDDGFRYSEDDLVKFFEVQNWEWTFNGTNIVPGCGIEENDDDDTIQKKWDTYKNKFPLISSKSQFDFKTKKG